MDCQIHATRKDIRPPFADPFTTVVQFGKGTFSTQLYGSKQYAQNLTPNTYKASVHLKWFPINVALDMESFRQISSIIQTL